MTPTFDILADYGWGYVRVAQHAHLPSAEVQAEYRFISSSVVAVQIRRSDSHRVLRTSDGRVMEWRR
jgi:hypothetical protein